MNAKPKLRKRGAPSKEPGAGKRTRSKSLARGLTPAEQLFVARYMVRMNATRAYQDLHPNVTLSSAMSCGSRMYRDAAIGAEIKRLLSDARKHIAISAKRVLDETAAMAFSNIADAFTHEGTIIPPNELPRLVAVAVKELKRSEILGELDKESGRRQILGHTIELKMHDKLGSLKLLGQRFGVYEPDPQANTNDLAALIAAAGQRVIDSERARFLAEKTIEGERVS